MIQNPEAGVPLIAGRPALLRVFVTGDQISFYTPHVRATLHLEGEAVLSELVEPGSDLLPDEVREDRIDLSYEGWLQYLREVEVLWNMEGRKGYYYGVVQLPQGSRPWWCGRSSCAR